MSETRLVKWWIDGKFWPTPLGERQAVYLATDVEWSHKAVLFGLEQIIALSSLGSETERIAQRLLDNLKGQP